MIQVRVPTLDGAVEVAIPPGTSSGRTFRLKGKGMPHLRGRGRGDAAADLLRQVERRYEKDLDRPGWLLLARLHGEIDAPPAAPGQHAALCESLRPS